MRILDAPPIIYPFTLVLTSRACMRAPPTNLLIPLMASDLLPSLGYNILIGGGGFFVLDFPKTTDLNLLNFLPHSVLVKKPPHIS